MEKHLRWYISTSEILQPHEKTSLSESIKATKALLAWAEREEKRQRGAICDADKRWTDDVNSIRQRVGRKPARDRRLVDELIEAILKNKEDHP